jgi:NodT family efflux transporter outer membrane factor (OMF) lipoprotein
MRKRLIAISLLSLLCSLTLLPGCMVGPNYSRPTTAADTSDAYVWAGEHNQDVNDINTVDKWWEGFGDPTTASLVRQALGNNYDLKATAARVLQARAALAEARGRRLPDVSYNLSRDRSKRSFTLGSGGAFGGGGRMSFMSTTWSQDISVAYILDLFGKLRRSQRAAWAEMFAAQATEQALVNSIIATVITARIDIATLQRRLTIANANTQSREDTLKIVERRYRRGLTAPIDVRLARENLQAAKTLEPSIELQLAKAHHALDVLLGQRPGESQYLPQTLADLPNLEPIPIGVPAALLDRRPDVQAAELSLHAANEQIGVSIAQLFPDLTLSASYGAGADRWRDIWEHYAETYSAVMRLAQPIFKGGQLFAQIDAAKARYAELAANYAGTVLTAMREVEDALASEEMLQTQLQYAKLRFSEAKAAEELATQRYQRGVAGILTILESQRRRNMAEEELTILKGQIWTTRVNVYLALGGDWDYQNESKDKT